MDENFSLSACVYISHIISLFSRWKSARVLFTDGPIPAWYVLLSLMLQQISPTLDNFLSSDKKISSFKIEKYLKVWVWKQIGRLHDAGMVKKIPFGELDHTELSTSVQTRTRLKHNIH